MGLQNWIHWAAWFVKSIASMSLTVCLLVLLLKVAWYSNAVIIHADWSVVVVFLLLYVCATVSLTFVTSAFFSSGKKFIATSQEILIYYMFTNSMLSQFYSKQCFNSWRANLDCFLPSIPIDTVWL